MSFSKTAWLEVAIAEARAKGVEVFDAGRTTDESYRKMAGAAHRDYLREQFLCGPPEPARNLDDD